MGQGLRLCSWQSVCLAHLKNGRLLVGSQLHEIHEFFLEFCWAHAKCELEGFYPSKLGDVWVKGI